MTKTFLDKAYGLNTEQKVQEHYDDWAASYDAEIGENGYQTPVRLARLLGDALAEKSAPVLDFGCGTGISGLALKAAGFEVLDGLDISQGMLKRARDKDIYRNLNAFDPAAPLPIDPGEYRAIAAIGVVSAGAAPPETLDELMRALAPGGLLAFSYNDHTLADAKYMERLEYWQSHERSREIAREYGEHLPGINLKSMIYVIEKS